MVAIIIRLLFEDITHPADLQTRKNGIKASLATCSTSRSFSTCSLVSSVLLYAPYRLVKTRARMVMAMTSSNNVKPSLEM